MVNSCEQHNHSQNADKEKPLQLVTRVQYKKLPTRQKVSYTAASQPSGCPIDVAGWLRPFGNGRVLQFPVLLPSVVPTADGNFPPDQQCWHFYEWSFKTAIVNIVDLMLKPLPPFPLPSLSPPSPLLPIFASSPFPPILPPPSSPSSSVFPSSVPPGGQYVPRCQ